MNRTKSMLLKGTAAIALMGPALAAPTIAQDDDAIFTLEEISVTARKRSENLKEVPAAVTAFSSDKLNAQNIAQLDDLGKYVPNLNISRYGVGNTAHASIFIRGIGLQDHIITTDPGVGVYLDGVYLGRQMGANLGLNNIERIEVLRGPQGTLYGRNTLGGAVNIITKKPGEEEEFLISGEIGTRGRVSADVYASTKLTDTFGMSLSGSYTRRNGVGEAVNLPNPEAEIGEIEEASGRLTTHWDVTDTFSITTSVDATDSNGGQSPYTIEFTTPVDPNNIFNGDFPLLNPDLLPEDPDDLGTTVAGLESTSSSGVGVSTTAAWEANDYLTAKFIGSYRFSEYTGGLDDDASPLHLSEFPERGHAEQYSFEMQFNGTVDAIDYVAGLYYFEEDGRTFSGPWVFSPFNTPNGQNTDGSPSFGGYGVFDLNQKTESKAAYLNVKYQVTDQFKVGGGIRYSEDDKEANALFPSFGGERAYRDANYDDVTWDVNASYTVNDDINVYAQVQKGYKPGGLPPRPFGGAAQFNPSKATSATNYEMGVKGQYADMLSFALSAFYTDYENLNLPISDTSGQGFDTALADENKSRAKGLELETTFIATQNFRVNTTVGYIDAEITEVLGGIDGLTLNIQPGDTPALTPKWTVSVAPEYIMDLGEGALTITADYSYRSAMFGQSTNNPFERMDERHLVGFTVNYESADRSWNAELYGKNIFNEVYDAGRLLQSGFVGVVRSNDRSEFGIRFTKRFGM